ncbi:hypothetical protein IIU_05607 [Bacillus cereus VD133]|uniref:Uncharacterized protein n=1 Tax=Bacillus cereus VD133 TaxID=1053233 RepID=A0A9W5PLN1_BACCE|nr:hypothetical protein [Bacillus cereus]EOO28926.1 hypothetical protein IIU_05607 [Bacillus cereus VD133]
MKKVFIITMIIMGVLSPSVSQPSDRTIGKNTTIEHVQMAFSDPGTG